MDIVNETANKVRELEKRLDDSLDGNVLQVVEIKKEFVGANISPNLYTMIAYYTAATNGSALVFQGQFNFKLTSSNEVCFARLLLKCDGYVIHAEDIEIAPGKTSFQVVHTLPSGTSSQKCLELVLIPSSGTCYLEGFNCFFWGYGVKVAGSFYQTSLVNACEYDGDFGYFVVNSKMGYYYHGALPTNDNFSIADFSYIGRALELAGGFIASEEESEENSDDGISVASSSNVEIGGGGSVGNTEVTSLASLYCFKVGLDNELTYLYGDNLQHESEIIANKVTSVSVVANEGNTQLTIVYSIGNSIYYFEFDGKNRTESMLLYIFDEEVTRVSLVENCSRTSYLVVSLNSGKNYLFSSVTEVLTTIQESRVGMKASISFN